jgi:16S rRNA (uracil1498-N3)-methyltransferase
LGIFDFRLKVRSTRFISAVFGLQSKILMTRRRWIADEFSQNQAALTGAHAVHLVRVLRVRVGQEFDISAGSDVRRGRVVSVEENRVEFELGERVPAVAIPNVTLALSIFKFDRMEWAIEKCTELGVARIIPVIARRTEAHLAAAAEKRVERWVRIAKQSAEQSRRSAPPEISAPMKLKDAVELKGQTRILLAESEGDLMLQDAMASHSPCGAVVMAIGPEGGWVDTEIDLFRQAGWASASLGATILRAETAAIAALAVVMASA